MPVFANLPETPIHRAADADSRIDYYALMGMWLQDGARQGNWIEVASRAGNRIGWVRSEHVRSIEALKIFFVDVGQGDAALIESPQGIVIIDGGPSRAFYDWLTRRAAPVIADSGQVHVEAMVVSHFDVDHFRGLTRLLRDPHFSFGTIYHNGIKRYDSPRPAGVDFDLGRTATRTLDGSPRRVLSETYNNLGHCQDLVNSGEMMATFTDFWRAALEAHAAGRLQRARRITCRDQTLPGFRGDGDDNLRIEVLAPVPTEPSGRVEFVTFPNPKNHPRTTASDSHTINGHSVVLKLIFGRHSFLFGGDLNIPAESYLMTHYAGSNRFRVDVAKACHHGSSDFSVRFLQEVRPRVSVFSSGDNDTHGHPMADALGASARWMRGDLPLLFSTELARAVSSSGMVKPGLISVRSNGRILVAAQKKETVRQADQWDSFIVPWPGAFPDAVAED